MTLAARHPGALRAAALTTEDVRKAVTDRIERSAKAPQVTVSLARHRGFQQITGRHLVRPDGTLALGSYGSVQVAGMTLPQAKAAVEQHLSAFLDRPEVRV